MKKLIVLLVAVITLLTACTNENIVYEDITMDNIDLVLFEENVQLVDLRNFEEKMNSGYVKGFTILPFFNYFVEEGHIVRTDGDMTFAPEDIVNPVYIKNFFDKDAEAIYLMCSSGKRSAYMLDVLTELGYENVYDLGGLPKYTGDYKVNGDGTYEFPKSE